MVETAAFLVDEVLPIAPYRQWTFTVPKYLRYMLVRDGTLLGKVFTTFLRVVFAWKRKQAKKLGIPHPLTGSVSFLQRYGSMLQLNPHIHAWLPDGVFYLDAQGTMQFQVLNPPDSTDIEELLIKMVRRVLKLCDREMREPDIDQMALATAQTQSIDPLTGILSDYLS